MSFHVTHRCGKFESKPPLDSFGALYDELAANDDEHPDVSAEHESAWSLCAFGDGRLVWENVEFGEPQHMHGVSRDDVIRLWNLLAIGDIDAVAFESWQNGYG